jgi:ferrous iron transport protein B
LDDLIEAIHEVAAGKVASKPYRIKNEPPELKRAISQLVEQIETLFPNLPNARWVALRLLDGDERIAEAIRKRELGGLSLDAPSDPSERELHWEAA